MAAITIAAMAIAAVILGWIAIEIACKPCLDRGREAIDRNLDPNYDPDSLIATHPTQPLLDPAPSAAPPASSATTVQIV